MEGNNGKRTGFVNNWVDALGRAVAWGMMLIVVISIVTAIGLGLLRTRVKNTIDFTMASMVDYAKYALLDDPEFTLKIRQNTREAVEYAFNKLKSELLQDEALNKKVRANAKEAIEYAFTKAKKEALEDEALNAKIKTNTKEAVEYLFGKAKDEMVNDPKFTEKLKTNVKEGIEYTVHQVNEHW